MFSLLAAMRQFLDTLTDGNPLWRLWAIAVLICGCMLLSYATRRSAVIGLLVLFVGASTWNFVASTYKSYQPGKQVAAQKWLR
jgi:VanZ family protein